MRQWLFNILCGYGKIRLSHMLRPEKAILSETELLKMVEAALEFFFEDCHMSMDHESLESFLIFSSDLRPLSIILRNSQDLYGGLSVLERIEIGAGAHFYPDTAALYAAKFGLSLPDLALARFQGQGLMGGSALHDVAEMLNSPYTTDEEGFYRLGVNLIRNGADLFAVLMPGERPRTPLLEFLCNWTLHRSGRRGGGSQHPTCSPLDRWNDMLKEANVDLEWYYTKEHQVWETLGAASEVYRQTDCACITKLVAITFCPETQECIPMLRDDVTIPVMKLHLLPGSFSESRNPITTICWEPSAREKEEEGHWSLEKEVVISGNVMYGETLEDESRRLYTMSSLTAPKTTPVPCCE